MKSSDPNFSINVDDPITKEALHQILFDNLKWGFALEVSNIGIWDYNESLQRVHFSKESKNILGITDDSFGVNINDWNDRVHPEDKEKYLRDFQDHLKGFKPLYENISRVKHVDGSYKWVLDKGKVIEYNDQGREKHIIGVHVDITKFKETEVALDHSIDVMTLQNNKLKNFAHIASHNLKEHAGNFKSLLSFYDEASTQDEKDQLLDHIKTVANSLDTTVNNLREIVNVDSKTNNKVEILNLRDYFEKCIDILAVEIKQTNASIINNIPSTIEIKFSKAYLQSIVQNLLTNAIKYRHPERDPKIVCNAETHNDYLLFTVTDNGLGIDLEKYGKDFFGLYKTFHRNTDSEGVGLYLTKSQVETMGGEIFVKSTVNIGSTFTIKLPELIN